MRSEEIIDAFQLSSLLEDIRETMNPQINDSENIKKCKDKIFVHLMKLENINDCDVKLERLKELYRTNENVYKEINFNLLDDKYYKALGEEIINALSVDLNIQNNIVELNDNQYKLFKQMLDNSLKKDEDGTWRYRTVFFLRNVKKYNKLVENIDDFNDEDIEKFMKIVRNGNPFNIETIEQLRDYENIKKQKCDEMIESDDIKSKKVALIYKIFGHSLSFAEYVVEVYGENSEALNDGFEKNYIRAIKRILELKNQEEIEELYQDEKIPEIDLIDIDGIEKSIKKRYGEKFNEGLFNVSDSKLEPILELGSNVYDVGTDFKIIMTSLQAFHREDGLIDDYASNWNRPSIDSFHVCCSYIRNDLIGTAPVVGVCYGFSSMKPETLELSNSYDITSDGSFIPYAIHGTNKFYSPTQLINETEFYNEIDYSRIQDGEKKKPDYIIVLKKEEGKLPEYLEEAQKASKNWNGLPIVVVDIPKILNAEREKVNQLIERYNNGEKQLAGEIYQKIRNNRVTAKMNGCKFFTVKEQPESPFWEEEKDISEYQTESASQEESSSKNNIVEDIVALSESQTRIGNIEEAVGHMKRRRAEQQEKSNKNITYGGD